jgi:hypothetical protein
MTQPNTTGQSTPIDGVENPQVAMMHWATPSRAHGRAPDFSAAYEQTGSMGPLWGALARAQGAFRELVKNRTVQVFPKDNPRGQALYTFDYATLDEVLASTRKALAENGLCLTQPLSREGGRFVMRTILAHESGAELRARIELNDAPDIQKLGSAITYLRRYSIQNLLGVAAEDDDDGNEAMGQVAVPQQRQQQARPNQQPPAPPPQRKPEKTEPKPAPPPAQQQAPQAQPKSEPPPPAPAPEPPPAVKQAAAPSEDTSGPMTEEQVMALRERLTALGFRTKDAVQAEAVKVIGKGVKEFTSAEASRFLEHLNGSAQ